MDSLEELLKQEPLPAKSPEEFKCTADHIPVGTICRTRRTLLFPHLNIKGLPA